MRREIKIKRQGDGVNYSYSVLEREYWMGFIPCSKWICVFPLLTFATESLVKSHVKQYIKEYYQIRRMFDGHYLVYRRYYFFGWYVYNVDNRINEMFDTEEEARDAIMKSLIR